MRYGRDVMGALSEGTVIFNGTREHEPKSVLDAEKTSGKSQRTFLKDEITDGNQPEPWRSNVMSRKWSSSRSHSRRRLSRWSSLRRLDSKGQGVLGVGSLAGRRSGVLIVRDRGSSE